MVLRPLRRNLLLLRASHPAYSLPRHRRQSLNPGADDLDARVSLDPVPYGAAGGFTVSLWMRVDEGGGGGDPEAAAAPAAPFQYLFSHTGARRGTPDWDGFAPNQARWRHCSPSSLRPPLLAAAHRCSTPSPPPPALRPP
jgi:hypothetical protein